MEQILHTEEKPNKTKHALTHIVTQQEKKRKTNRNDITMMHNAGNESKGFFCTVCSFKSRKIAHTDDLE